MSSGPKTIVSTIGSYETSAWSVSGPAKNHKSKFLVLAANIFPKGLICQIQLGHGTMPLWRRSNQISWQHMHLFGMVALSLNYYGTKRASRSLWSVLLVFRAVHHTGCMEGELQVQEAHCPWMVMPCHARPSGITHQCLRFVRTSEENLRGTGSRAEMWIQSL